jgi:hypothetical protein
MSSYHRRHDRQAAIEVPRGTLDTTKLTHRKMRATKL